VAILGFDTNRGRRGVGIHYFCLDLDATKTALITGFNRNTINSYFSFFREAIAFHQTQIQETLKGTVELDESYFGATRKRGVHGKLKRGRGTIKQPVFGMIQRQDKNGQKYVFTEIVPDCKKATLLPLIQHKADPQAIINADSWASYDGLVAIGYEKLFRVNHGKNELVFKGEKGAVVTVNGIESFWSFTKRRLSKFNGYMSKLNIHLKECEWRWIHSPPERNQSKKDQEKYLLDLQKDLWKIYITYKKVKQKESILVS
jgi:transposase